MNHDFISIFKKLLLPAISTTMYMVGVTTILATIFGFMLAIVLINTSEDGLRPNKIIYGTLDTLINIVRSFPFIILLVSIIPLTKFIVGTSIGMTAAIVPLTVASSPFVARLIETSLKDVDKSLIEAARAVGATNSQIIFKVLIKESIPAIVSNITLAIIAILSSSAMAGAVGAGGLGAVALVYGYQNFNYKIMYSTVIILIVMVQLIQKIGSIIYNKLH